MVDSFVKKMKERLKEKGREYGELEAYSIKDMRSDMLDKINEWIDLLVFFQGTNIFDDREDEILIDIANYCYLVWYLKRRRKNRAFGILKGWKVDAQRIKDELRRGG